MHTYKITHASSACNNVHQVGKLMVTLAVYGSVSDAYYAKSNSTHANMIVLSGKLL